MEMAKKLALIAPKSRREGHVVFGPCRLSYTHVFQKYSPEGDAAGGKYMTNILIPKGETATVDAINAAIDAARKAGVSAKWGGKEPRKLELPLRDGDEKDDEAYHGHYYLNAKSSTRPGIVGPDKQPIYDEEEVYSGCYAICSVTFYPYDVSGNRGVACGLNNLMKAADGPHMGGRVSAEADFDGVDGWEDEDL